MGPPRKICKIWAVFWFFRPTEKMGREGPKWGGDAFLRHKKTSPTIWAERILILRTFDFWILWVLNLPPIVSWVKNIFRNLPPFFSWVKNIFRNLPPFFYGNGQQPSTMQFGIPWAGHMPISCKNPWRIPRRTTLIWSKNRWLQNISRKLVLDFWHVIS